MLRRSTPVFSRIGIALIVAGMGLASAAADSIWDVKVIHPNGEMLDVKAVDSDGTFYDVKAIEEGDNPPFLDVKAFVDGEAHDVKVVASKERYAPVMALGIHGKNLDIRALSAEGKQYDVKGIRQSGNIIDIRAIGLAKFFRLEAIAPDGRTYEVKGVKMMKQRIEMVIGATQIHAHVKAFPPKPPGGKK